MKTNENEKQVDSYKLLNSLIKLQVFGEIMK